MEALSPIGRWRSHPISTTQSIGEQARVTLRLSSTSSSTSPPSYHFKLPQIPPERLLAASLPTEKQPLVDPSTIPIPKTVLYLAYGSNLSAETFRSARGIRPLAATNVLVPSLTLTFHLPGIPYSEPCFANTALRQPPHPPFPFPPTTTTEPSSPGSGDWPRGLVGVVYELTPEDYAHVIATEGGGASYADILVACHPLPPNTHTVPTIPTTMPFVSHTLFAPPTNIRKRDEAGYAQPSARYLKLLTDGAAEHGLPGDYQRYLARLKSYKITNQKQEMGGKLFLGIWGPVIALVFWLGKRFQGEDGKSPTWLVGLFGWVFWGLWGSYDMVFKRVFGDGERTEGDKWDGKGNKWKDEKVEIEGTERRAGWMGDIKVKDGEEAV